MTTTAGDMVIELHTDELPITTGSFLSLIDEGHYNGLHFHRVISGFMIQGGCPHSRDPNSRRAGTGGPEPNSSFTTANGTEMTRNGGGTSPMSTLPNSPMSQAPSPWPTLGAQTQEDPSSSSTRSTTISSIGSIRGARVLTRSSGGSSRGWMCSVRSKGRQRTGTIGRRHHSRSSESSASELTRGLDG